MLGGLSGGRIPSKRQRDATFAVRAGRFGADRGPLRHSFTNHGLMIARARMPDQPPLVLNGATKRRSSAESYGPSW
jgi:hypothetical protein